MESSIANMDYLAARLHGRRSRLAEGERLDSLSRSKSFPVFAQAVFADTIIKTAAETQQRLVRELMLEMSTLLHHLTGVKARLMEWMLMQFQIVNLKIMIRGFFSHTPPEILRNYLIPLPGQFALEEAALLKAQSLEDLAQLLPAEPLGRMLHDTLNICHNQQEPFFVEATLDQKYFQEELVRAHKLSHEEHNKIMPLIMQEIDIFHLMLVLRGRFHHKVDPQVLASLQVEGTHLSHHRFKAMLTAPDATAVAQIAIGRVLDSFPSTFATDTTPVSLDLPTLEALAWKRYLKLANRIFRQSLTDFGIIAGYIGVRRMENINLITLSEGIRAPISDKTLRLRMIPPLPPETSHA